MKKMAVVFPGVGYHSDKPLLYYSKKLVQELGYEVVEVTYSGFPARIFGDKEKMLESFRLAMEQTKDQLKGLRLEEADDLLFISKSIGTAVAADMRIIVRQRNLRNCPSKTQAICLSGRET